jgi:hypothetical protein
MQSPQAATQITASYAENTDANLRIGAAASLRAAWRWTMPSMLPASSATGLVFTRHRRLEHREVQRLVETPCAAKPS